MRVAGRVLSSFAGCWPAILTKNNPVFTGFKLKGVNMLKRDELATPTSCLNKAGSDEPVFVLRATDHKAPMTIRHWATMSEGSQPAEKLNEARRLADEMDDWRKRNVPPVSAG